MRQVSFVAACASTVFALSLSLPALAAGQSPPSAKPPQVDMPVPQQTQQLADGLQTLGAELRRAGEELGALERDRLQLARLPGPPIWSNWVLIGVTLAAIGVALGTLRQIAQQARAAVASAGAAKSNSEAVLLAERAYVDMAHVLPGVKVDRPPADVMYDGPATLHVKVRVKNHGHTPADVLGASLAFYVSVQPLPETPPYSKGQSGGPQAFLVTNKQFFIDASYTAPGEQWSLILSGKVCLWVLGYVDYRDRFGRNHRAGYARVFLPGRAEKNNLGFLTTPGYNYDRELGP